MFYLYLSVKFKFENFLEEKDVKNVRKLDQA